MGEGAIVQLGIPRVVAGLAEWEGQRTPSHRFLLDQGVEVVDLQKPEVDEMMLEFVAARPDDWQDDLGAAIAGMDISNGLASSVTEVSPSASRARMARRVGSASAAKVELS